MSTNFNSCDFMSISLIGYGAWGKAFAMAVCKKTPIKVWVRNKATKQQSVNRDINNGCIQFCDDIKTLVSNSSTIVSAVPTKSLREICELLKEHEFTNGNIIACCKGIDPQTLLLPTEVINSVLPKANAMAISGPSFAKEIKDGLPCHVVLTGQNESIGQELASTLNTHNFYVSYSRNYKLIQLCAAMKNIVAIACGITRGLNLGRNAEAIVITKGFNDIIKLCDAINIEYSVKSVIGYACFGDLVMTCNAYESRNMTFGIEIATNKASINTQKTIEGLVSVKSLRTIAQNINLTLSLCETVYNILYNSHEIKKTILNFISTN